MSDREIKLQISRQLMDAGKLEWTDLDGKKATLDERIADELGVAYGMTPRFRWPKSVAPKLPTWWERRRMDLADTLRAIADRVWYVNQHEHCD
jgi:hypothetical protein